MSVPHRNYGTFYWPLALTSLVLLLETQFQNGVLARYPRAEVELATFALATSSFQLVNALLIFVPQMVTVLSRTRADRAICRKFVVGAGVLFSLPLLAMGYTNMGRALLAWLLNIPPDLQPAVVRYLQWLAPLIWVNAVRHYCTGILILGERTRTVTLLNIVHLCTLVGILLGGRRAGWNALPTLALATVLANVLHLALAVAAARRVAIPNHLVAARSTVNIRGLVRFFWPLAATSGLFAMSRPVLYASVNLTSQAVVTIAALRVAFDFTQMFQNPVNQFRHVYATYGADDPQGVARFMFKVTSLLTALMGLVAFTPLSRWLFGVLLGLEGDVLLYSVQASRVMCLTPLILGIRNLHHGRMMVERKTRGMAVAALLRMGAILAVSRLLFDLGWLNHVTASVAMVVGFLVETVTARRASGLSVHGG